MKIRYALGTSALLLGLTSGVALYDMYDVTDRIARAVGCKSYFTLAAPLRASSAIKGLSELPQEDLSKALTETIRQNQDSVRGSIDFLIKDKDISGELYRAIPEDAKDRIAKLYLKEKYNDTLKKFKELFD